MRKVKKLINIFLVSCFILVFSFWLVSCKKKDAKTDYLEKITNCSSYYLNGVIESYHNMGKKDCEFEVYSKKDSKIKVVLKSNDNKQYIVKNENDVYIVMPQVNKSFKIDNSWPLNSSYPYLLESISKDISNCDNVIKTEDEKTITFEVEIYMFSDSNNRVKEKIIIDKNTLLPKEVQVYDKNSNLKTRCVFTNIELDKQILDDEFKIDSINDENKEVSSFESRTFEIPRYMPIEVDDKSYSSLVSGVGNNKTAIMKFESVNDESSFTVIQEYQNKYDEMKIEEVEADIVSVMGLLAVLSNNQVSIYHNGINYTIASDSIEIDELIDVLSSYLLDEEVSK